MRFKLSSSSLSGDVEYRVAILKGLMCDVRTVHKLHFIILIYLVTYQSRSDITRVEMFVAGLLVMLHVDTVRLNTECSSE